MVTTQTIRIEGMGCAHSCAHKIRRSLETLDGLTVEEVTLGEARVQYDPVHTTPEAIAAAIEQAGYRPVPPLV